MEIINKTWHNFSINNDAILSELASAYRNKLDAFRELIGNSFDADAFNVSINLNDVGKIIIDDDGTGLENLDQYTKAGNLHKKNEKQTPILRRLFIGRKGIGRLAINMLGSTALMSSNNGKETLNIVIKFNMDGIPTYQLGNQGFNDNYSKNYKGTKIIITDLKTTIREDLLIQYLNETFAGIVNPINSKEYPLHIFLNGNKLKPVDIPSEIVGKWNTPIGPIEYWLKPTKAKQPIKILWRGTHIKTWYGFDTNPCIGFININFLDPDPSRGDFKDIGDEKNVFEEELRNLILKKIPKQKKNESDELNPDSIRNSINILSLLKKMGYPLPKSGSTSANDGNEELGIIRRDVTLSEGTALPTNQEKEKSRPDKISKGITRYGIKTENRHLGRDTPVIVTDTYSNIVTWNLDHPMHKIMQKMHGSWRKVIEYPLLLEGYSPIVHPVETFTEFKQWRDSVLEKAFWRVGREMPEETRLKQSQRMMGNKIASTVSKSRKL